VRRSILIALALATGSFLPVAGAAAAVARAPLAAPDPGGIGIRLLDAPTSAGKDPRARIYIVDHLKPGTVISRRVEVTNTTDSVRSVAVYPGTASIHGGTFSYADGRTPSELTQWTKISPATVSLAPGAHAPVTVTISVPPDASPGERYGVVWAENAGAAPAGGGLTLVTRAGVRLYLSVGPGGAPAAKFALDGLAAQRSADGSPSVVAQVRNTGGRALDLSGALKLTDGPAGLAAGPFPATLGVTLAPGDSSPVTVLLDRQIPDGPWQADLTLKSGLLEQTTKATLTFPASQGSLAATAAKGAFPWWLVGLGTAAGLLSVAAALLVRRRALRARTPPSCPRRGVTALSTSGSTRRRHRRVPTN
jgi:hypothetical protein